MKRHFARAAVAAAACAVGLLTTTGPANAAEGSFFYQDSDGEVGALFDPQSRDCLILSDGTTPLIVFVANHTDRRALLFDNLLCAGGPVKSVPRGTQTWLDPNAGVKTVWFGRHSG